MPISDVCQKLNLRINIYPKIYRHRYTHAIYIFIYTHTPLLILPVQISSFQLFNHFPSLEGLARNNKWSYIKENKQTNKKTIRAHNIYTKGKLA